MNNLIKENTIKPKKERVKTPSFVHELSLKTNKFKERKLSIKFKALRELFNFALAELFKRQKMMYNDPNYKIALSFYKNKSTKSLGKDLFKYLNDKYFLNKGDIQAACTKVKNNTYMKDHLDGDTVQVISDRAFDAFMSYKTKKKGKPRFKSWKKGLRSISGKKNACVSFTKDGKVKWKDLLIDVKYDQKDKHQIQAHALNQKIKYCRIVNKSIRGKDKYFLQLVVEGIPKSKHVFPNSTVGLDIGVSTAAAVNDEKAILEPFCYSLETINNKVKKLQRKNSKKLRLNNPNNYQNDFYKNGRKKLGKIKKGKKTWIYSNNYKKNEREIKDLFRVQADKRKTLHNIFANDVLSLGKFVKIENNNYKAWQKGWFGKTIGFRAPSSFVSILTRKAESAGGKVDLIDTWSSKLSQYCHVCDSFHKKSLSERTHNCGEITVQRDLYSALLIKHYNLEARKVNTVPIFKNWKSFDTILNDAVLTCGNKFRKEGLWDNKKLYSIIPTCLGIQEPEKRISHNKAVVVSRIRLSTKGEKSLMVDKSSANKNRTP